MPAKRNLPLRSLALAFVCRAGWPAQDIGPRPMGGCHVVRVFTPGDFSMVRQDQPQSARSALSRPSAAPPKQAAAAGYRSEQSPVAWNEILAALSELGFQTRQPVTPPAVDVVLAAQLRLRYWRRQLPCGRVGGCLDDESDEQRSAAVTSLTCGCKPALAEGQGPGGTDASFIKQRIRTIKSARDCLLACSRQAVRVALAAD